MLGTPIDQQWPFSGDEELEDGHILEDYGATQGSQLEMWPWGLGYFDSSSFAASTITFRDRGLCRRARRKGLRCGISPGVTLGQLPVRDLPYLWAEQTTCCFMEALSSKAGFRV